MESIQDVKTAFNTIVYKLERNAKDDEKKKKAVQDIAQKLLSNLDGENNEKRRLYLYNLIIDFVNRPHADPPTVTEVIKAFFPSVINKRQLASLTNLISLGLTLHQPKLLNQLENCVRNSVDVLNFPVVRMSPSLAKESPLFCSVVISNGYFNNHNANKENLTDWLRCLADSVPQNSLVLNQAIRYSFLEKPTNYELHLVILQIIQQKRCQNLTNQFLIDLATTISRQDNSSTDLIDRFGQMLILCYANNLCSQSNQLKNILLEKFNDNPLIMTLGHIKLN